MIKGYQNFYYSVKDISRAVQFYEQAFQMKKVYATDYWVSMALGNLLLGLHWNGGELVPPTPRDAHGQSAGGTLTLLSDNVPDDRKRRENAGGRIIGDNDEAWGHILVFEDLDGNVLNLMNPKY